MKLSTHVITKLTKWDIVVNNNWALLCSANRKDRNFIVVAYLEAFGLKSHCVISSHFGVRLLLRIFEKKRWNARGFAREYLRSCSGYGPGRSVKRCSKSSSLHLKRKFLLGGCVFFVSAVISGRLLGHLGPLCLALGANR